MQLSIRLFRKEFFLAYLTVICLFTLGIFPKITLAQATTVSVQPPSVSANPGGSFTVDINIVDVTNLFSWQIKVKWERNLLRATSVVEGEFLARQGGGTGFAFSIYTDYIDVGCTSLGGTVDGEGILMSVTFQVLDTGETTLDIYFSQLLDSSLNGISHTVQDGSFFTTRPVASFAYSPNSYGRPLVGESVTFDASASYDPGVINASKYTPGIVSYDWYFGDSATGTGRIVTHAYGSSGNYNVTLKVTDTENETDTYSLDGRDAFHPKVQIKFHDIAVLNVTATPRKVLKGSVMTIEVKVMNNGSHTDTFNVTAYYFDSKRYKLIQTKTKTELLSKGNWTETLQWNTTNVDPGTYDLYAYAYLVDLANLQLRPGEEENTANNALFGGAVNVTLIAIHDIAIKSAIVAPTDVKVGGTVGVSVLVKNEGNVADTFNVEVYNGTSLIGNQSITLLTNGQRTLNFPWFVAANNTVERAFNVSAGVGKVSDETNLANNNITNVTGAIQLLPVAYFTLSPSKPILNQTVTFDASGSYAPGLPAKTISSYSWNFGDGSPASSSKTATHAYDASGSYSVALTVVDSAGLSDTLTKSLTVPKLNSTITISATVTTVPIGSKGTVITGSISPVRVGVNVSIYYVESGKETWISLANVTTEGNIYSYIWTPWLKPGTYKVQANWAGDGNTFSANSSIITINVVQKGTSVLDISVSQTSIKLGESISIDGSISPVSEGLNITIWYMVSGSDWSKLADVATEADGGYAYDWEPENSGTYVLKASWSGNEVTYADESDVQIVVVEEAPAPDIFLYTTLGLAVALAVAMVAFVYFLRVKKPKSP